MKRSRLRTIGLIAATAGMLAVAGCRTAAESGAVLGALAGAGVGQAIGGNSEATVIGAAIGGAAGYMIGNEEDKNAARGERARIYEEMNYVTVNVRNSNGSISRVRLRKEAIGYIGTRGEYYEHLPTEEQLRPIYGF